MRPFIYALLMMLFPTFLTVHADEYGFPDSYPEVYQKIEVLPYSMHGWNLYEHVFDPLLAQQRFKTVIEVGVFLGKMTIYLAKNLPEGSRYFSVDHWKGSEEHFVEGTVENSCLQNFYQQFLSNIIHAGLTDRVIPVKMNSLDAAEKFAQLNIKADLIYIDAAHDYISVLRDLNAWFPMLAPGGMFCGDDWHYGGVQKAVQQFAKKRNFQIVTSGNFWQLVY